MRVVHLNDAITLQAVLGLNTLTVAKYYVLVSAIIMPHAEVTTDIIVGFKCRLLTESEAEGALDRLYQCKDRKKYQS